MLECLLLLFLIGVCTLVLIIKNNHRLTHLLKYVGYLSVCLCLAAFPLYFTYCKVKKQFFAHQLKHIPLVTIDSISGYYNVHDYLQCKTILKSLHKHKWWKRASSTKPIETLRFATTQFDHTHLDHLFKDPIPRWIHELVEQEFAYYSLHPFSSADIQKTLETFQSFGEGWEQEGQLALFSIRNGSLFVKDYSNKHFRLEDVSTALNRLCHKVSLPDLDFLVSFHDHLENKITYAPIFVFSKKSDNHKMILIPDHEQLMGYEELNKAIDHASQHYPWDTKKDLAFWRGGTSGGIYTDTNWAQFPRAKLTLSSLQYPELLDAKFAILVQGAQAHEAFFMKNNMIAPIMYPEEQLQYRYLVDVDGNASTYSRFYWILRSNCTPVKQVSAFMQWYYPLLIPYQHYLPIREDLSDLEKQLQWIKTHSAEAERIAEMSRSFAQEYLSAESTYLYLYAILLKYKECFSNEK